ncbi:MAG: class I SAM-dependent methyltransferase, partial [Actinomycetota bacterium]
MDEISADLRRYYDGEAAARAARAVDPVRARWRNEFVELLQSEDRTSVVEVGCGPGRDAPALAEAGLDVTGLDLSLGALRLTAAGGTRAVQASLYHPPFREGSVVACWTMSTLVHVPDARFDEAMTALVAMLAPGAPMAIGLWGGVDDAGPRDVGRDRPPDAPVRFFSRRGHDRVHDMLAAHGDL